MRNTLVFVSVLFCFSFLNAQDLPDSTVVFPFKAGNKWTFRSRAGFMPGAPYFDSIFLDGSQSYFGYFQSVVSARKKYGLVRYIDQCDTIIPVTCDSIIRLSPMCYFVKQRDNWKTCSLTWNNKTGLEKWVYEDLGKLDSVYVDKDVAYFWQAGKMGVKMFGEKAIFTNYPLIQLFDKSRYNWGYPHQLRMDESPARQNAPVLAFLVSDGRYFGLIRPNKELIPCTAKSIQPFNELFCRYWNGVYWIYVRYKDGFKIDPHGGRVVFYSDTTWKIYSANKKNVSLYVSGILFSVKGYEDYFMLSKEYVAVRTGDKIGLLNRKGVLLIPPRFEQIDKVGTNLFRVLDQGKWYLATENGAVLSQKGYDFIGSYRTKFEGKTVFDIHQGGKSGVLSANGSELIAPVFSEIEVLEQFILAKEGAISTVFGSGGKKIGQNKYAGYNLTNDLLIMYFSESHKDVFSKQKQLNQFPFAHIADLGEVVKLYGKEQLEVLVLNSARTELEERQVYAGAVSFKIAGFKEQSRYSVISDFRELSYLEECQQSGFFGYRKTFDTTHLMKPDFIECFSYGAFNWDIGVRHYREQKFTTRDSLRLVSLFDFQIIDSDNAKWFSDSVTYTSVYDSDDGFGIINSGGILTFSAGKGNDWLHDGRQHQASEVVAVDYSGVNSFAYYLGGNYTYTYSNDPDAVSNYTRFTQLNGQLNLAPAEEGIAEIMNPALHKKLSGGRWFVAEVRTNLKTNSALQDKYYSHFRYLNNISYEIPLFLARSGNDNWNWNYQVGDSVSNVSYSEITLYNDFMLVKRLVKQDDGSYKSLTGLCMKNREVVVEPIYDSVTLLSWDLILVSLNGKYGVLDMGKNWVVPL